jgi:hypothetical protein
MLYGQSSLRDDCSDSSAFVEVVMDTPNEIPSQQWARTHWPADTTSAASVLLKIAKLAQGLSGRTLKRLVTYARHEYVTDEPGDLRDMLAALEIVVGEKVAQGRMVERGRASTEVMVPQMAVAETQMEQDELMDTSAWISRLEAGQLNI